MSEPTVTYSFSTGDYIQAAEFNTDFQDILDAITSASTADLGCNSLKVAGVGLSSYISNAMRTSVMDDLTVSALSAVGVECSALSIANISIASYISSAMKTAVIDDLVCSALSSNSGEINDMLCSALTSSEGSFNNLHIVSQLTAVTGYIESIDLNDGSNNLCIYPNDIVFDRNGESYIKNNNNTGSQVAVMINSGIVGRFRDITVGHDLYGSLGVSQSASVGSNLTVYDGAVFGADIEIPSTGAIYWGGTETDGTWRLMRSGNDMVFQRRESGSYTTKSTISA